MKLFVARCVDCDSKTIPDYMAAFFSLASARAYVASLVGQDKRIDGCIVEEYWVEVGDCVKKHSMKARRK